MKTDRVITAMIEYFGSDKKRIHHFLKVYSFAKTIGESENLLPDDQELLEISAIVHDIGIKVSEEKGRICRRGIGRRYGWPPCSYSS